VSQRTENGKGEKNGETIMLRKEKKNKRRRRK
jgi:hypothetical protein